MNEMNGRKVLQEQAHGRGKKQRAIDIMKAFRWSKNLNA
jgi:hypothetical protein